MSGVTYSRDAFLEARQQWKDGKFGWQWESIRKLAAERGFIFPPSGTRHDDRDIENPSQRAIVWAALEENPTQLQVIIRRSRSWSDVVDGIIGMEARLYAGVKETERDVEWERKDDPDARGSLAALGSIFDRVAESLGYVRKDSA